MFLGWQWERIFNQKERILLVDIDETYYKELIETLKQRDEELDFID